ncbi:MAG: hypothetical protein IJM53_06990 [Lachnospiraceae bacterium]|nr:hypothetical protein [Lachnospiraceae bacterium]
MKSRKILGILLAMLLVISLLPMTALADEEDYTNIDEVNLEITAPKEGTVVTAELIGGEEEYDWDTQSPKPDVNITDSDSHCHIYEDEEINARYWVDPENESLYVNSEEDPYMMGGETYYAYVSIYAEEGYAFLDEPIVNVTGGEVYDVIPGVVNEDDVIISIVVIIAVNVKEEIIESVDVTITAPKCGTVVTADGYDEPIVRGKPGVHYYADTQSPKPEITINDSDALYDLLTDEDGDAYSYWLEKKDEESYELYVNWEEHPCMVGGETVYAEFVLAAKGAHFPMPEKAGFGEEIEINLTGGTVVDYMVEGNILFVLAEVEVEHIEGEPVTENVVDPLCLEDGSHENVVYCDACGAELSREPVVDDQLGHDWGEWTVVKEPQVGVAGEEQRICKRDPSHVETREIAPLEEEETEKPTEKETEKDDNPQTNDNNNMWMWIAFMGVAALGIAGSAVYDKKRKKD